VRVLSGRPARRDRVVVRLGTSADHGRRRAPDLGEVVEVPGRPVSALARAREVTPVREPQNPRIGDEPRRIGSAEPRDEPGAEDAVAVVRPGQRTVVRARRADQAGALPAALRREPARDPPLNLRAGLDGAVELAPVGEVQPPRTIRGARPKRRPTDGDPRDRRA
jgi:hypothetical protein